MGCTCAMRPRRVAVRWPLLDSDVPLVVRIPVRAAARTLNVAQHRRCARHLRDPLQQARHAHEAVVIDLRKAWQPHMRNPRTNEAVVPALGLRPTSRPPSDLSEYRHGKTGDSAGLDDQHAARLVCHVVIPHVGYQQCSAPLRQLCTYPASAGVRRIIHQRALSRCVMRRSRAAARHISSVWCVMLS